MNVLIQINNMKTAKEVFDKHYEYHRNMDKGMLIDPHSKEMILSAMNEYAIQFMQPKDCYQCEGTGTVIFPSKATQQCMICNGTGKLIVLPIQPNT